MQNSTQSRPVRRLIADGDFDRALESAQEQYRGLAESAPSEERAIALIDLANARDTIGQSESAEGCAAEAISLLNLRKEELGQQHTVLLIEALLVGCSTAGSVGMRSVARVRARRAHELSRQSGVPPVWCARAALACLGEHDGAALIEEALRLTDNTSDDELLRLRALALENRAGLFLKGLEAADTLREALELYERTRGPTHIDVGRCLIALGHASVASDDWDTALASFQRARKIYEDTPGEWQHPLATCGVALADVYERLERFTDALAEIERVVPWFDGHPQRDALLARRRRLQAAVAELPAQELAQERTQKSATVASAMAVVAGSSANGMCPRGLLASGVDIADVAHRQGWIPMSEGELMLDWPSPDKLQVLSMWRADELQLAILQDRFIQRTYLWASSEHALPLLRRLDDRGILLGADLLLEAAQECPSRWAELGDTLYDLIAGCIDPGNPSVIAVWLQRLRSEHPLVRLAATWSGPYLTGADIVEALEATAAADEEPQVRTAAAASAAVMRRRELGV